MISQAFAMISAVSLYLQGIPNVLWGHLLSFSIVHISVHSSDIFIVIWRDLWQHARRCYPWDSTWLWRTFTDILLSLAQPPCLKSISLSTSSAFIRVFVVFCNINSSLTRRSASVRHRKIFWAFNFVCYLR